jgi:RNA polymerase sigma factor (TIGR02999 family)
VAGEITKLLAEARSGDPVAVSRLSILVYDELHRLAARFMAQERRDHTLQATALVHEAYMELVNQVDRTWQNRAHFFAMASQFMRRILVDHARSRNAAKRGGGQIKMQLDDVLPFSDDRCEELILIDEALTKLSAFDNRMGQVVELKFFVGLTEEEIGEALRISTRTVKRDWQVAKAWLRGELSAITE